MKDGDGAQGLLILVHQDRASRIYYIDGYHEGRLFPLVRAKAVVFMNLTPIITPEGREAVQTVLVSYIRLDNRMLSAIVALLSPLVGEALIRTLARGFEATNRLSQAVALDAEQVTNEMTAASLLQAEELESFKAALAP